MVLLVILLTSVAIDISTKDIAEKKLLLWSSKDNLKEYRGDSIHVFSVGENNPIHDKEKFFLAFNFTYVRNQGAAWGMLSDMKDEYRVPFFHLITLIAVLVLLYYMLVTPFEHKLARFAFILILSGAIGNFADRIRLGYVIDFLDFQWVIPLPFVLNFKIDFFPSFLSFLNMTVNTSSWAYEFPKFNWADSMITTGVILLIFDMMVLESLRIKRKKNLEEQLKSL